MLPHEPCLRYGTRQSNEAHLKGVAHSKGARVGALVSNKGAVLRAS